MKAIWVHGSRSPEKILSNKESISIGKSLVRGTLPQICVSPLIIHIGQVSNVGCPTGLLLPGSILQQLSATSCPACYSVSLQHTGAANSPRAILTAAAALREFTKSNSAHSLILPLSDGW